MGAAEQVAESVQIVAQIFDDDTIDRAQNAKLIPESFRAGAELMKILGCRIGLGVGQRFAGPFVTALNRAPQLFAGELIQRPAVNGRERLSEQRFP